MGAAPGLYLYIRAASASDLCHHMFATRKRQKECRFPAKHDTVGCPSNLHVHRHSFSGFSPFG